MSNVARVSMFVSPSMAAALEQLDVLLSDYNYSPRGRAEVLEYVAREGTTAGCPSLDPEDHHDAEMILEENFPPVPFDSPAWDRDTGVLFDAEMLADGSHPWPIPVVGDDDDRLAPADEWPNLETLGIMPIAGGAPEPFEPSEEDAQWWAEQTDRPARRSDLDPDTLGRVRAALWGPDTYA